MDKPFALIIDDDRDIVALFRHVLDMAGYRTEIVLHGKTAMERLSTCVPDIVLLDLNLPGVRGVEILHFIRSTERLKTTQVVVVTGYSHIAQSLEEDAELVLLKPVDVEQLSKLVQRLRPARESINESPLDSVTGCYNQSFFRSRLEYSLARLVQLDLSHFAVLYLEAGQYDALGKHWGAEGFLPLQKELAGLLKATLRPTDTIARLEGTMYAILIEDIRHWDIPIRLANRILDRFGRYFMDQGMDNQIYIGITLCHAGYPSVNDILRDAATSLSLARSEGKSGYKFYVQDDLNNEYNLDMVSEMISLMGAETLKRPSPARKTGVRIKPIQRLQPRLQY